MTQTPHSQSVGLPWTSDRSVAEASTCTTPKIHKRQTSVHLAEFEPRVPA